MILVQFTEANTAKPLYINPEQVAYVSSDGVDTSVKQAADVFLANGRVLHLQDSLDSVQQRLKAGR